MMCSAPAFARILPFAIYIAFLPLREFLPGVMPEVDLRWIYGLQVGLVVLCLAWAWPRCEELADWRRLGALPAAAALLVGVVVFVLWIRLDADWMVLAEGAGYDPRGADGSLILILAATRVVGAAAVVPIMEELFWRSFVQRWIDQADFRTMAPAAASLKALAVTSVLFGLEHNQWLAGIVAGFAYGWLYKRWGNLWVPILAHAVTNLILGLWVLQTENWQFW